MSELRSGLLLALSLLLALAHALPRVEHAAVLTAEEDQADANARQNLLGLRLDSSACTTTRRVGSAGDGGWTICADGLDAQSHCVVHSLGSRDDISFDVAMAASPISCEVHAFDPGLSALDIGDPDRNGLSSNDILSQAARAHVAFHDYGLGGRDEICPAGQVPWSWPGYHYGRGSNDSPWRMRTLSTSMADLNHSRIEVLKIDSTRAHPAHCNHAASRAPRLHRPPKPRQAWSEHERVHGQRIDGLLVCVCCNATARVCARAVEGSEWPMLERLLEDIDATESLRRGELIRQIVMEAHFLPRYNAADTAKSSEHHPRDDATVDGLNRRHRAVLSSLQANGFVLFNHIVNRGAPSVTPPADGAADVSCCHELSLVWRGGDAPGNVRRQQGSILGMLR